MASDGWAHSDGEQHVHGPFVSDMVPPKGVLVTDMPSAKPAYKRPKIKGVAGPTAAVDEDHQPGGGQWRDVS